jgi:hypothetical protein
MIPLGSLQHIANRRGACVKPRLCMHLRMCAQTGVTPAQCDSLLAIGSMNYMQDMSGSGMYGRWMAAVCWSMPSHMPAPYAWHAWLLQMPDVCIAGLICGIFHAVKSIDQVCKLVQACNGSWVFCVTTNGSGAWAGPGAGPYSLYRVYACPQWLRAVDLP